MCSSHTVNMMDLHKSSWRLQLALLLSVHSPPRLQGHLHVCHDSPCTERPILRGAEGPSSMLSLPLCAMLKLLFHSKLLISILNPPKKKKTLGVHLFLPHFPSWRILLFFQKTTLWYLKLLPPPTSWCLMHWSPSPAIHPNLSLFTLILSHLWLNPPTPPTPSLLFCPLLVLFFSAVLQQWQCFLPLYL